LSLLLSETLLLLSEFSHEIVAFSDGFLVLLDLLVERIHFFRWNNASLQYSLNISL
jgi:hypothetical protein